MFNVNTPNIDRQVRLKARPCEQSKAPWKVLPDFCSEEEEEEEVVGGVLAPVQGSRGVTVPLW